MWLQQVKRPGPLDRLVPAVHVELAVDALDVRPDRAHRDDERFGDLWAGQVGRHQAQHFYLALAEWLNQRHRTSLFRPDCEGFEQTVYKGRRNGPTATGAQLKQQSGDGRPFIQENAAVILRRSQAQCSFQRA
jgi:hypothetical protein